MSDEIHIYLHQLHALWNRYKNKEFSLDQIMEKFATSAKMDRVLIELYLEAHWKEHNQLDKDLHERFWHYVPEFVTAARNWKRPDAESKNPPDRLSG